jgi:hypothetical protein
MGLLTEIVQQSHLLTFANVTLGPLRSQERPGELVDRLTPEALDRTGLDRQRYDRRAVPEQRLHLLDGNAVAEGERCEGVAQIVKPKAAHAG